MIYFGFLLSAVLGSAGLLVAGFFSAGAADC